MRKLILTAVMGLSVVGLGTAFSTGASASEGTAPKKISWSFDGMFGTFDRAALKRGSEIYFQVCSNCHSMEYMSFRNLVAIGMDKAAVKKMAAGYDIQDGPNDEGDMFTRPRKLSDPFPAPFANKAAATAANGGAYPPDLSLIVKARTGGADYIYSILTGFVDPAPKEANIPDGAYYNTYFPNHRIAMPPPLSGEDVDYADGTKATMNQEAHDVVTFLAWAAEPEMEARKALGIKVLLFLVVMSVLLYFLKHRIWSRISEAKYTHGPHEEMYQKEIDKHKFPS